MTRPLSCAALVVALLTGVDVWLRGYDAQVSVLVCFTAQIVLAAALFGWGVSEAKESRP